MKSAKYAHLGRYTLTLDFIWLKLLLRRSE